MSRDFLVDCTAINLLLPLRMIIYKMTLFLIKKLLNSF